MTNYSRPTGLSCQGGDENQQTRSATDGPSHQDVPPIKLVALSGTLCPLTAHGVCVFQKVLGALSMYS